MIGKSLWYPGRDRVVRGSVDNIAAALEAGGILRVPGASCFQQRDRHGVDRDPLAGPPVQPVAQAIGRQRRGQPLLVLPSISIAQAINPSETAGRSRRRRW